MMSCQLNISRSSETQGGSVPVNNLDGAHV